MGNAGTEPTELVANELECLRPRSRGWWRWSPNGPAIEWSFGRTIAFATELADILGRLAPDELPPVGPALIVLAATRSSWSADEAMSALISCCSTDVDAGPGVAIVHTAIARRLRADLQPMMADISAISSLPPPLREPVAAKVAIMRLVLPAGTVAAELRPTPGTIAAVRSGVDVEVLTNIAPYADANELLRELEPLAARLHLVTPESVERLMKTGVETAPSNAGVDLPAPDRLRKLIASLREDPELGGVARAAAHLMSVLHVPRRLAQPEDVSSVGISDLSNRGPLDRLLLSELANDDLTLMTRVALGEALYLKRESPERHPPIGRRILIDVGVRMWGVPRLFGMAVAMALAGSTDRAASCETYRTARGGKTTLVSLDSLEGVTAAMAALEPDPTPVASLLTLLQASPEEAHPSEVFVVTHLDALRDPEMTSALARLRTPIHVATVDVAGHFGLTRVSPTGNLETCRATLSLEGVFPKPAESESGIKPYPLSLRNRDPDLPAILHLEQLPLLLPAEVIFTVAVCVGPLEYYGITHDGRLMWFKGDEIGGQQVTDVVPPGTALCSGLDVDRKTVHFLIRDPTGRSLHLLSCERQSRSITRRTFSAPEVLGAQIAGDHVVVCDPNNFTCISLTSDTRTSFRVPAGAKHLNANYYLDHPRVLSALPSGLIPAGNIDAIRCDGKSRIAIFDRPHRGPWILTQDLSVTSIDRPTERLERTIAPANLKLGSLVYAAPEGDRLLISAKVENHNRLIYYSIDLSDPSKKWVFVGQHSAVAKAARNLFFAGGPGFPRGNSIRFDFKAVGLTTTNELVLSAVHRGSKPIRIGLDARGSMAWKELDPRATMRQLSEFHLEAAPKGARYRLWKASFADGSRVFLDSRGLLHLVSADPTVPQIAIALGRRDLAGWSSDGTLFGHKLFHGSSQAGSGEFGLDLITRFVRRIS